jgi:hypothetical protein
MEAKGGRIEMAVFDHIPMGEEGLKEVYQWLDDWVAQNKGMARKEVIGKSPDLARTGFPDFEVPLTIPL